MKDNPRLDPLIQIDILGSSDFQVMQGLREAFSPWKEAFKNGEIPAHSAQEYAILLFQHGLQARGEGNYGIAAMTVWRPGVQADQYGWVTIRPAIPEKGIKAITIHKPELAGKFVEMDVFGHNKLFRQKDTNGHAERQATETAVNVWLQVPDDEIYNYINELENQDLIIFREAPNAESGVGIVTTLEPCPGCSEMVITAGYDWVLSLNEDVSHGTLHSNRIAGLGCGWVELAEQSGIKILFSQENNPSDQFTFLPSPLASIIARLFFDTRKALDEQIGHGGVLMLYPGVKKKI